MVEKFYRWGIAGNSFLWFHMLAGAVAGKISPFEFGWTVVIVLILSALWELGEELTQGVAEEYGTAERFWYDAAGDVIGAVLLAGIVAV